MFYFMIAATPKPDTEVATETGGAYVNCWVDFKLQGGAEAIARYYIDDAGWIPGEVEDVRWAQREDYQENQETLVWFTEAEEDGVCLVFHNWPVGTEEEEAEPEAASA